MKYQIKTYINKEKRTVVTSIYDFNKKYIGKAKCSKDDEFDLNIGKQISLKRAWIKYDEAKLKEIRKQVETAKRKFDELKEKELDYVLLLESEKDKLDKIFENI